MTNHPVLREPDRIELNINWDTGNIVVSSNSQTVLEIIEPKSVMLNERGKADFTVTGINSQRKQVEHEVVEA